MYMQLFNDHIVAYTLNHTLCLLLLCSGNVQKLSNPTFNPDITLDAVEEPIKMVTIELLLLTGERIKNNH